MTRAALASRLAALERRVAPVVAERQHPPFHLCTDAEKAMIAGWVERYGHAAVHETPFLEFSKMMAEDDRERLRDMLKRISRLPS